MATSSTLWKERFRVPLVRGAQVAADAPTRGLVASNVSGVFQLHAWDVASGQLRALTNRATGVIAGAISPDGRFVYYHDDAGGNELGHFVRVPFEGGTAASITPGVPPYPTFGLGISGAGNRLGFVTADEGVYHVNVIDVRADGALGPLRRIQSRPRLLIGPAFSHDGAIAVLVTTPEARSLRYEMVALDTATGRTLGELADANARVYAVGVAPRSGDGRLLAVTNQSGVERPLIWDVARGSRLDIVLDELERFEPSHVVQHHDNFRVQVFVSIQQAKINRHFMRGTFSEGLSLVPHIIEKLEEFSLFLDKHRILVFNYKIASLYFGSGDYNTTIDYVQRIINEPIDLRSDLQCYARLLHLLAHYELGNFGLMEPLTKSVFRFMAKMENLTEIEEEIFRFLRNSLQFSRHRVRQELEQFLQKIKHLEKNRFETRAFAYLDIISWVESKVYGKPMSDIIYEKYLNSRKRNYREIAA